MNDVTPLHPQLSFAVEPVARKGTDDDAAGYLVASIKVSGDFVVGKNLHPGEEFTVQIASADGEVIAGGVCVMEAGPSFPAVKNDGRVIGYERRHVLKVDR